MGAGGASAAGSAAGAAGNQAYQNTQTQIAQNRADLSPYTNTGRAAESQLSSLYGLGHLTETDPVHGGYNIDSSNIAGDRAAAVNNFQTSPGYNFRLQQGVNALDRSAASRGTVASGAQMKALNDYGQGQASSEYGNYVNALSGLAGGGQSSALGVAGIDTNAATQGNALQMQGSMAQAKSYSDSANAIASGIKGGVNSLASILGYGGSGGTFGLPGWV